MISDQEYVETLAGIDDAQARAIGYFTIAFSEMERALNHAIWSYLHIFSGNLGHNVTAALNIATKAAMLERLAAARLTDAAALSLDPLEGADQLLSDCKAAIRAVYRANDHRNNLLHGFQHVGPGTAHFTVLRIKADKDAVRLRTHAYPIDFVYEIARYTLSSRDALVCADINYRVYRKRTSVPPSLDAPPQLREGKGRR